MAAPKIKKATLDTYVGKRFIDEQFALHGKAANSVANRFINRVDELYKQIDKVKNKSTRRLMSIALKMLLERQLYSDITKFTPKFKDELYGYVKFKMKYHTDPAAYKWHKNK